MRLKEIFSPVAFPFQTSKYQIVESLFKAKFIKFLT